MHEDWHVYTMKTFKLTTCLETQSKHLQNKTRKKCLIFISKEQGTFWRSSFWFVTNCNMQSQNQLFKLAKSTSNERKMIMYCVRSILRVKGGWRGVSTVDKGEPNFPRKNTENKLRQPFWGWGFKPLTITYPADWFCHLWCKSYKVWKSLSTWHVDGLGRHSLSQYTTRNLPNQGYFIHTRSILCSFQEWSNKKYY